MSHKPRANNTFHALRSFSPAPESRAAYMFRSDIYIFYMLSLFRAFTIVKNL